MLNSTLYTIRGTMRPAYELGRHDQVYGRMYVFVADNDEDVRQWLARVGQDDEEWEWQKTPVVVLPEQRGYVTSSLVTAYGEVEDYDEHYSSRSDRKLTAGELAFDEELAEVTDSG
jgi:hypothetical protein